MNHLIRIAAILACLISVSNCWSQHLPPYLYDGDPDDGMPQFGTCEGGHTHPLVSIIPYPPGGVFTAPANWDCPISGCGTKVLWHTSCTQHYYVSPYWGQDCYSAMWTYVGYGTIRQNLFRCRLHYNKEPALYWNQPNPTTVTYVDRSCVAYVRNYLAGAEAHAQSFFAGSWGSDYVVECQCEANSAATHWLVMWGPNNWWVYGPNCL